MVGGWCTFFHFPKQLVLLLLTAEGWWYMRQFDDFALSTHDVMYYPHDPPPPWTANDDDVRYDKISSEIRNYNVFGFQIKHFGNHWVKSFHLLMRQL